MQPNDKERASRKRALATARQNTYRAKNIEACLTRTAEWRAKNPDKVKAHSKSYYAENRAARVAKAAARREANPEQAAIACAKWRKKNPDAATEWNSANRHLLRARDAARRARKLNATPAWDAELTDLVAIEAADLCAKREAATGFLWEVDHMIPLQAKNACGLHVAANLQVIPLALNRSKGNKMQLTEPLQWLR